MSSNRPLKKRSIPFSSTSPSADDENDNIIAEKGQSKSEHNDDVVSLNSVDVDSLLETQENAVAVNSVATQEVTQQNVGVKGCHATVTRRSEYCRRPAAPGQKYCKLHMVLSKAVQKEIPTALTKTEIDRKFPSSEFPYSKRCEATTSRGRPCAFVAVNCTKFCNLHADFESNPPKKRRAVSKKSIDASSATINAASKSVDANSLETAAVAESMKQLGNGTIPPLPFNIPQSLHNMPNLLQAFRQQQFLFPIPCTIPPFSSTPATNAAIGVDLAVNYASNLSASVTTAETDGNKTITTVSDSKSGGHVEEDSVPLEVVMDGNNGEVEEQPIIDSTESEANTNTATGV